MREKKKEPE